MDATDRSILNRFRKNRTPETELTLVQAGTEMPGIIESVFSELESALSDAGFHRKKDTDLPLPGIRVRPNLLFCTAPSGHELEPFLESLITPDPGDLTAEIDEQTLPSRIDLYITGHCPFCPGMVRRILPLSAFSQFQIRIIDGLLFPQAAADAGVQSAPTLIIDDTFRWTGMTDLAEITAILVKRDVKLLGPGALINILQEGRAEDLANRMIEAGDILPAFFELLTHEKWPVRLGALVCLEYMADQSPELVRKLETPLISAVQDPKTDSGVKGDALQALGMCGTPAILPVLLELKDRLEDPDLLEALSEAVETIRKTAQNS